MPGTLIIEAMAQTSTFLFYQPDKRSQKLNFYLGVVKDARFLKPVLPKTELKMTAEPLRLAEDSAHVKVEAVVNDEVVSKAELVFVRRKG
jgi:3-hydroxyacyl-[acyl-carrier-protein] dehydratase